MGCKSVSYKRGKKGTKDRSKICQDEKINLRFKDLISDATNDSLAPFVIVKTMPTTKWKNVVNAIDELNITNVKKRAIMDMEAREALLFLTPEKVAELKLK